ncbi:MAG: hypothetical protein LV481_00455 [Methylacidiphilales bacterium]|nr:hypothetical protein [Candidatus Methylacidiphilales bacterium]
MAAHQKIALFNLIVAMAALVLFLALTPLFGFSGAQAAFALFALIGFTPLFYRRRKGQIFSDERDNQIRLAATTLSFAVVWLIFVGGVMGAYYYLQHLNPGIVGLEVLPDLVWFGFGAHLVSHSAAILTLYRRL